MTALTTLRTGSRMNSRIRTSTLQCAATYGIARHVRFSNPTTSRRLLSTSTPSEPTLRRSYLYGLFLTTGFRYAHSINPSPQCPPRQIACWRSPSTSEFPQTL